MWQQKLSLFELYLPIYFLFTSLPGKGNGNCFLAKEGDTTLSVVFSPRGWGGGGAAGGNLGVLISN